MYYRKTEKRKKNRKGTSPQKKQKRREKKKESPKEFSFPFALSRWGYRNRAIYLIQHPFPDEVWTGYKKTLTCCKTGFIKCF